MQGPKAIRVLLAALPVSAMLTPGAAAQEPSARCPVPPSPPGAAVSEEGAQPARLEEKPVRFARGGSRDPSDRTIVLSSNPPLEPNAEVFAEPTGDLDKEDASDSFAEEGVVAQASVTRSGDVRLKVCIDPEQPEKVEYGRYVGTIRIAGAAVEPTAIPLEITLRRPPILAVVLLFVGSVVGILAKAAGDRKSANETVKAAEGGAKLKFKWSDYLLSAGFFGGLLGGIALVALAYAQIYDADPDWGTALDIVVLTAAGAGTQVSGRTLADVVAPYVPK
jgi:hypothetical protein